MDRRRARATTGDADAADMAGLLLSLAMRARRALSISDLRLGSTLPSLACEACGCVRQ